TRQLETPLRQFHIQTSHQTPEIARAQAQSGSRNLKVAVGIDYGALDESPLEVVDARIETAGRIGGFPFRYRVWQILRLDEFRPAEDQPVLDGVGELTHITRPGAGDEGLHRFAGNSG